MNLFRVMNLVVLFTCFLFKTVLTIVIVKDQSWPSVITESPIDFLPKINFAFKPVSNLASFDN